MSGGRGSRTAADSALFTHRKAGNERHATDAFRPAWVLLHAHTESAARPWSSAAIIVALHSILTAHSVAATCSGRTLEQVSEAAECRYWLKFNVKNTVS